MTGLAPTNETVAIAWLKASVTYLGGAVATELPTDNSSWSASGFVQVSAVGGSPGLYVPVHEPVVQLDFWAVSPNANRPPWGKANQLAAQTYQAVMDHVNVPKVVTIPGGTFSHARVMSCWFNTEPRRIKSDVSDFARYTADMSLLWVSVGD